MKKANRWKWGVAAGVVLLVVAIVARWIVGDRWLVIEPGRDTTRIVSPLRADGTPDYIAALNEHYGRGARPEENAAVLILETVGPDFIPGTAEGREALAKQMGASLPAGKMFKPYVEYRTARALAARYNYTTKDRDGWWDEEKEVQSRPWKKAEFPEMAEWIESQRDALANASKASSLPRYFVPMVGRGSVPTVYGCSVESLGSIRALAAALASRGMNRVAEGEVDKGVEDVMATLRLGRMLLNGQTLLHRLVGISIEEDALRGLSVLMSEGKIDAKRARGLLAEFAAIKEIPPLTEVFDLHERYECLDHVVQVSRFGPDALGGESDGAPPSRVTSSWRFGLVPISFADVLRAHNGWFDRATAAWRIEDYQTRNKALADLGADVQREENQLKDDSSSETALVRLVFLRMKEREKASTYWESLVQREELVRAGLGLLALDEKLDVEMPGVKRFLGGLPKDRFGTGQIEVWIQDGIAEISSVWASGDGRDRKGNVDRVVVRRP